MTRTTMIMRMVLMMVMSNIPLLKVMGQVNALEEVLPELPESPYLIKRDEKKRKIEWCPMKRVLS